MSQKLREKIIPRTMGVINFVENYPESKKDKRKMVVRFSSREITCDLEKEKFQWERLGQKHNGGFDL